MLPRSGTDGIARTRLETGHGRLLATLFGTVRVTRCAWRKPGSRNYRPADAALSLPGRAALSLPGGAGRDRGGPRLVRGRARRGRPPLRPGDRQTAARTGRDGRRRRYPAFYAARIPQPCTSRTLVVLSADCKGIVMRPGALRAATAKAAARLGKMRTRLTAGEKPNRKRMATLVTVYDAASRPMRRPHDVIAPPGGRRGARRLRAGPKARGKWLTGSVPHDPAVIAAAFDEAERRDPHTCGTGRPDRREQAPDRPITAEAARRGITVPVVIDFIHVLELSTGPDAP